MFVGYSLDHPTDSYHFIYLSTKRIIHGRDVKWLDKTWGQYYNIPTQDIVQEEIEIYEDNENQEAMSERTKHVDTRAHFVRTYVINEVVTIEFVKKMKTSVT